MRDICVSIVAPAFSEEEVIESFVRGVQNAMEGAFKDLEVVIVDDGSTDGTHAILERLRQEYGNLVVLKHPMNRGLGAGLETGFRAAKGDVIVTMDADGTHDPGLIPKMVAAIQNGADVVVASRYVPGGGMDGVPRWRQAASIVGNLVLGRLMGWPVCDGTSGFRAYRREVIGRLEGLPAGFEVQGEILRRLGKGIWVAEVPLRLTARQGGRSKMRYAGLLYRYLRMTVKTALVWRAEGIYAARRH